MSWSDETTFKEEGKRRCNEGLGKPTDVSYQNIWPMNPWYTEVTTELYKEYYGSPLADTEGILPFMGDSLNIFCMTWNTESINICGYKDDKYYGSKTVLQYPNKCFKTDQLMARIKNIISFNNEVDILVFGFQESAKPGDYFFSYTLPDYLKKFDYMLLKRNRAIGAGLTTLTKQTLRGLRSAIFVKRHIYESLPITVTSSEFKTCGGYTKDIVRGKGGLEITLDINGFGKYMFLNYHLPFSASRLNPSNLNKDNMLESQTQCFLGTYEKFVNVEQPDYVFVMGDLNYRIQGMSEKQMFKENGNIRSEEYQVWYERYDELKRKLGNYKDKTIDSEWVLMQETSSEFSDSVSLSKNTEGFKEGVNNEGPRFAPTCKMLKGREPGCTTRQCYQVNHRDGNIRAPSWCDRILYYKRNSIKPEIETYVYDRIDTGEAMACSDHTGVYGIFKITK